MAQAAELNVCKKWNNLAIAVMRMRPPRPIEQGDQNRIIAALERLPEKEGFVGYRTRAFVYLLWDGALRTGAAVYLNAEEVVKDPNATRIHVVEEPVMRPCEGNKYRERRFVMSERTRAAIADYLREARRGAWLAKANRLEGPLWISTYPAGEQQRMSRRTAMQAWKTFLEGASGISADYQLDDVVLTGRVAFAMAANASPELISEHAGIGTKAAAKYSDHVPSRPGSPRDVMSQLNQKLRRKQG
jgi:integrase